MRILVFAALLGSFLYAQTPLAQPSEPIPAPQAAAPSPDPARVDRTRARPRRLVTPNDTGYVVLSGMVPSNVIGHFKFAPAQSCSIPLLDAAPKGGFHGDPKIVLPGPGTSGNPDRMPVAQGSPPCAPSKP